MADSRFEKSLDVSESSEESEAGEAMNDETLAEYPEEVMVENLIYIRKPKQIKESA